MLQSPIKPKSYGVDRGIIQLTQMFGENPDVYGVGGHTGWDFRTKHFVIGYSPVLASHDGIIMTRKDAYDREGGKNIKILSPEMEIKNEKGKFETRYMHLTLIRFDIGTEVKKGQLIGYAGTTGQMSTGYHLHWDVAHYFKAMDGSYKKYIKDTSGGCVNPLTYIDDCNVFQYGDSMYARQFFCNGKQIQRSEVDSLIPKQYL